MSAQRAGCPSGIPGSVRWVAPAEEHAWIAEQLSTPIREPRHVVWIYTQAAIVLGRSQRKTLPSPRAQLPMLERLSGGGAVLVTPALVGAAVALPCGHAIAGSDLVTGYRWLGNLHARALRRVGVPAATVAPADLVRTSQSQSEVRWACFGALSPWEVVSSDQRKLVGLAQVRRPTGTVLVAGTLVGVVDWSTLAAAVGRSEVEADHLATCTTNCEAELGRRLSPSAFAAVLSEALAGGASWMPSGRESDPYAAERAKARGSWCLPPVR